MLVLPPSCATLRSNRTCFRVHAFAEWMCRSLEVNSLPVLRHVDFNSCVVFFGVDQQTPPWARYTAGPRLIHPMPCLVPPPPGTLTTFSPPLFILIINRPVVSTVCPHPGRVANLPSCRHLWPLSDLHFYRRWWIALAGEEVGGRHFLYFPRGVQDLGPQPVSPYRPKVHVWPCGLHLVLGRLELFQEDLISRADGGPGVHLRPRPVFSHLLLHLSVLTRQSLSNQR